MWTNEFETPAKEILVDQKHGVTWMINKELIDRLEQIGQAIKNTTMMPPEILSKRERENIMRSPTVIEQIRAKSPDPDECKLPE